MLWKNKMEKKRAPRGVIFYMNSFLFPDNRLYFRSLQTVHGIKTEMKKIHFYRQWCIFFFSAPVFLDYQEKWHPNAWHVDFFSLLSLFSPLFSLLSLPSLFSSFSLLQINMSWHKPFFISCVLWWRKGVKKEHEEGLFSTWTDLSFAW